MNKETIIRFTDVNVDGCGTDVTTDAKIKGPKITEDIKTEINNVIDKCKKELENEYTTDDILNEIDTYLKSVGYTVEWLTVIPDIEIQF